MLFLCAAEAAIERILRRRFVFPGADRIVGYSLGWGLLYVAGYTKHERVMRALAGKPCRGFVACAGPGCGLSNCKEQSDVWHIHWSDKPTDWAAYLDMKSE